jgi:hypothetical protein
MTPAPSNSREGFDRVPAIVFACLLPGELRVTLHPGVGLADGGIPCNVPASLVQPELRMPNTLLWIQFDEERNIVRVWRREGTAAE